MARAGLDSVSRFENKARTLSTRGELDRLDQRPVVRRLPTAPPYTLIQTAKLNDVDPQAWLADVLARINDHSIQALDQLLPWNWKPAAEKLAA
jgi:hypothetical protein